MLHPVTAIAFCLLDLVLFVTPASSTYFDNHVQQSKALCDERCTNTETTDDIRLLI